jgi:probable rRNA maturation factor
MIRFELNQSRLRGGQRLPRVRVAQTMTACARALKLKRSAQVSLAFLSTRRMRELNRAWRGKDCVTDVLSFALDEGTVQGEIVLNYEQAARQATQAGHPVRDEMLFLIVHGMLHLWGHDHEQPSDARKMFVLQDKILRSLKINPHL